MPSSLDELRRRKAKALELGGAAKVERLKAKGSSTARERICALLDPDAHFLESGMLNHSDVAGMEDKTAADGKICGFGPIDGRTVAVTADDPTILAGSGGRVGSAKAMRVHRMAIEKGYPIVNLGEAGGARIPDIQGSDGLSSMTMKAEAGRRMRRVPMISTIMGECFGAPSWMAALSDFVVQVKGSCMAVSGPRVLEMATGERVGLEELGGWKLHAEVTGQIDRVAEDEADCFRIVREFVSFLPSNANQLPPRSAELDDDADARQAQLNEMVPVEPQRGYDMTRVIQAIVDHERIFPIKPDFDRSVIACLARLDGYPVGIIASQPSKLSGAMGPEGCDKSIAFLCLCDSFHIPVILMHDTPGFRVGKDAEAKRMPSKIINFIEALAMTTVPKISLVIRKSYGMAYSNMGGHGMGADFEFAWPGADISFMAPEVAANVVYQRKIEESANPEETWRNAVEEMRLGSAPWRAAGLGYLDDVIEPAATRRTLIRALELARGASGGRSQRMLANWPTSF
ncbi:MAG TPA: carboxyl transferase domain-containing protein [Bryobacteraceae bacterium]|jgi:acetyl-CoA carboxylase carboxyltransferase component